MEFTTLLLNDFNKFRNATIIPTALKDLAEAKPVPALAQWCRNIVAVLPNEVSSNPIRSESRDINERRDAFYTYEDGPCRKFNGKTARRTVR